MYAALEPFIAIAIKHNCSIVFLHHEGKTERENVGQRGIGSTGIPAIMATTISMQKQNGLRYLESEGRNIKAFDRLVLHLNESTGVLTAEGTYSEVATNKHDAAILQALADAPLTTSEIVSAVPGDKKEVKTAFYALVKTGRIHHVSGAGTKGNPKLYGLPVEIETCSRVPLHDVDADDNEYDESGLPVFDVDVD